MSRKCKDSPSPRRGCSVGQRGHFVGRATLCEKANLLPRSSSRPGTASSDMIQLDRQEKGIEGTFGWLQALATSGHDEPVYSLVPSAVLASTERHDPSTGTSFVPQNFSRTMTSQQSPAQVSDRDSPSFEASGGEAGVVEIGEI